MVDRQHIGQRNRYVQRRDRHAVACLRRWNRHVDLWEGLDDRDDECLWRGRNGCDHVYPKLSLQGARDESIFPLPFWLMSRFGSEPVYGFQA